MLGYRRHFYTKSRRYSTALRALRSARADWKRRQHLTAAQSSPASNAVVAVATGLSYAGRAGAPAATRYWRYRPPHDALTGLDKLLGGDQ